MPWSGWTHAPVKIAARTEIASLPLIEAGQVYDATLNPAGNVMYAVEPGKLVNASAFGGMFRVRMGVAAKAGIALSGPTWVDGAHDGKALVSTGHGHGPACSTIRKIVWFDLPAGETIIQLTGAVEPSVRFMMVTD